MKLYWQLFCTFVRIGSFTIGGGYAMIPLIQKEVVDRRGWLTEKDFLDMLALAQSAPGVIAVNTAIFLGYKMKGIKGAIVTSLGAIVPPFTIILAIAMLFVQVEGNTVMERIFKGIRPAVVALIIVPIWRMAKTAQITWKNAIIPIGTAGMIYFGVSPALIVALGIIGGIVWYTR